MVESSKFDLILVDFDLGPKNDPKLSVSGTGLVFELRAAKVGLPILMYTVLEGEWYELASLHAGADGYILKSTSIQLLISRLHAHIRRYERDTGKRRAPRTVLVWDASSWTRTTRFWPTTKSQWRSPKRRLGSSKSSPLTQLAWFPHRNSLTAPGGGVT